MSKEYPAVQQQKMDFSKLVALVSLLSMQLNSRIISLKCQFKLELKEKENSVII